MLLQPAPVDKLCVFHWSPMKTLCLRWWWCKWRVMISSARDVIYWPWWNTATAATLKWSLTPHHSHTLPHWLTLIFQFKVLMGDVVLVLPVDLCISFWWPYLPAWGHSVGTSTGSSSAQFGIDLLCFHLWQIVVIGSARIYYDSNGQTQPLCNSTHQFCTVFYPNVFLLLLLFMMQMLPKSVFGN